MIQGEAMSSGYGNTVTLEPDQTVAVSGSTLEEYRDLAAQLAQRVVKINVHVSRFRGRGSLHGATTKVGDVELTYDDGARPGGIDFMPDEWRKRFDRIEGALRRVVSPPRTKQVKAYGWSVTSAGEIIKTETLLGDTHVAPRDIMPTLRADFERIISEQWAPAVNELIEAWPSIREARRQSCKPDIWDKYGAKAMPSDPAVVRAHFNVLIVELPLGVSVDDLTVEALQSGAGTYLDAVRDSIVQQSIETLTGAADRIVERINKRGIVNNDNIAAMREAVQAFRSFGDLIDHAGGLDQALQQAQSLLDNYTIQDINKDRATDQYVGTIVKSALEALRDRALDLGQPAGPGGGRYSRGITL